MKYILKYKWLLLILWLAVTVAFTLNQPNLNQILSQKGEMSLGDDAPSKKASVLLSNMSTAKGDSILFVFTNPDKLTTSDYDNIKAGLDSLDKNKEKLHITNIIDPIKTKDAKDQLISKDKTTLMVQVNYEKKGRDTKTVMKDFKNAVADIKVKNYITGELPINNDYLESVAKGADKSAVITVIFILVVLIIIFRSVVTPLVSLLSVAISYLCSMGVIGILINTLDFPVTTLTQMFLIVILFGIGTDYHILLFNRYREELGNGLTVDEAIIRSYKTAGKTIFFSGLTVFIGFASLSFVSFPIYRSANAVAIGIAALLIEMMTFTPLMMKLLSTKLFWPTKQVVGHKDSKLWERVTTLSVKHPVISLVVVALVLSPIIFLNSHHISFDNLKDLPNDSQSVIGFNLVKDKFGAGKAMPTTVVIQSKNSLDNNEDLRLIDNLTEKLKSMDGVKQILGPTQPKGEKIKQFYTNEQTRSVVTGLSSAKDGVDKIHDGISKISKSISSPDFSQVAQLSSGTGSVVNGMTAINNGLIKINSGIDQGAGGAEKISKGIGQLKTGVAQLNAGLSTISDKLVQVQGGYDELAKGYEGMPGSISQLKQVTGMMNMSLAKLDVKLPNDPDVATLKAMVANLDGAFDKIVAGFGIANGNFSKLNAGLAQLNGGLKQTLEATTNKSQLVKGIEQLETASMALSKGLQQGSAGQKTVIDSINKLKVGTIKIKTGQDQLLTGLNKLSGGMGQLKDGLDKSSDGLNKVSDGISKTNKFLNELTNTRSFYMPKEAFEKKDIKKMFDAYMSKDRKTTKLTVVLDYEPYSDKSIALMDTIQSTIGSQFEGTSLANAKYGVTGVTAHSNDLSKMANHDIIFTEVIVLVSIFILLLIIIRSFWISIYVVLALVTAYYTALSSVSFISKQLFENAVNGLSWNVPFFAFVAITSLGVDYSIFLLMRFREYQGYSIKEAIILASKNIGGVVISAAIILSGTFATMYPSNLIVLMELAIGVVIGLLMLSFLLLPFVIPALISLTDKISEKMHLGHIKNS